MPAGVIIFFHGRRIGLLLRDGGFRSGRMIDGCGLDDDLVLKRFLFRFLFLGLFLLRNSTRVPSPILNSLSTLLILIFSCPAIYHLF